MSFRTSLATFALAFVPSAVVLLHSLGVHNKKTLSGDLLTYSHQDLVAHAESTFAILTRGEFPVWEQESRGWRDQCEVRLVPEGCVPLKTSDARDLHFRHSLETAPQTLLRSADPNIVTPDSSFPKVLQTIYYNDSAWRTIEVNKLSSSDQLKERLKNLQSNNAPLSDMTIPDFAPDAIVVKTFWEVIYRMDSGNGHYASGASLFHKGLDYEETQTGRYPQFGHWTSSDSKVYVDISENRTCEMHVEEKHPVYSLGCFYYRRITEKAQNQIALHPSADHDIHGGPFSGECYLVLVGVHIMTRETRNWFWMTFWWSADRLGKTSYSRTHWNKWSLFEANATVNNTDPVANPYLEGTNSGMFSNCLECHRHAVYHGSGAKTESVPIKGGDPVPRYAKGIAGSDLGDQLRFEGNPPAPMSSVPAGLRDLQSPSCYFGEALQTHFLWTIALNSDAMALNQSKDPCPPSTEIQPSKK